VIGFFQRGSNSYLYLTTSGAYLHLCLAKVTGDETLEEYISTVPFEALDRFYFEEVVGQMPASLRGLAVDLRVLRKKDTKQHITTLSRFYANDYLFVPWILDDVFDVPEEIGLTIGQAYILLIISCVVLDQLVDRQMADIPTIPLVQQHLLLKTSEVFSRQFESPGPFWDQYYACLSEFMEALALESDCLDGHAQPCTYELMCQVCTGKAAPLRTTAYALALSSGNMQPLAVLNPALNNLLLADQLSDDAFDWREDYQAGRYTLPVILALEAAGDPLEVASALNAEELEARLESHGILTYVAEQVISVLKETRTSLKGAGLAKTKLYAFLGARIERMQRQRRYYQTIRLLGGLIRSLEKK
jgi:hypothetical protein